MIWYIAIFIFLFIGFWALFTKIRWIKVLREFWRSARAQMDDAFRQRLLANRRNILVLQQKYSVWYEMERHLQYSGWKRMFPFLTAELWVLWNIVMVAVLFGLLLAMKNWIIALLGCVGVLVMEYLFLCVSKARERRRVNENLIRLLNFLGNYSITAGEVAGILHQISKYVDEPIKSALEECYYEAQTTGDTEMALLVMAEKIEHPKFKELALNLEISIRYCADFTALVEGSRRSVRQYIRIGEERKGMLKEAATNMLLLLGMSLFAFLTVNRLVEESVWNILFHTIPGYIALGGIITIFLLFVRQVLGLNQ